MTEKIAYTTVINTSGGRKYFSFLPPHGLTLHENQAVTFIGNIDVRLIPGWPYHSDKDRPPNKVKLKALKQAEEDGLLTIIRSPESIRLKTRSKIFTHIVSLGRSDPFFNKDVRCVTY